MKLILNENKTPKIKGSFFIKGVIHIIDEDKNFEVLEEQFFYTGLEPNGWILSKADIDVYLEHELEHYDWNIEIEVDRCYAVLFEFELNNTQYWTAWGYEYDSEVVCKQLHIIPVSDEANKWYLQENHEFEN